MAPIAILPATSSPISRNQQKKHRRGKKNKLKSLPYEDGFPLSWNDDSDMHNMDLSFVGFELHETEVTPVSNNERFDFQNLDDFSSGYNSDCSNDCMWSSEISDSEEIQNCSCNRCDTNTFMLNDFETEYHKHKYEHVNSQNKEELINGHKKLLNKMDNLDLIMKQVMNHSNDCEKCLEGNCLAETLRLYKS